MSRVVLPDKPVFSTEVFERTEGSGVIRALTSDYDWQGSKVGAKEVTAVRTRRHHEKLLVQSTTPDPSGIHASNLAEELRAMHDRTEAMKSKMNAEATAAQSSTESDSDPDDYSPGSV